MIDHLIIKSTSTITEARGSAIYHVTSSYEHVTGSDGGVTRVRTDDICVADDYV